MDLPAVIAEPAGRLAAAAQNALEVARFGGFETDEEPSPYEVVARAPVYRLRRYFPEHANKSRPPVVLVPPMMLAAEVWDVSPQSSAVATLDAGGVDPWVVDFGAPEREEGGLERTLTDHVLAVSDAVDRVRAETGADVHLGGYSQGGMFAYQTAAYRRSEGLASLVTFGSPVDVLSTLPLGISPDFAARAAGVIAGSLGRFALPAWASRTGFRLMDPVKSLRQRIAFVRQLHDREALLPRERQRRFLEAEGWVAWPGPALAELFRQFVAHNRMMQGGFVIEDRLVTLADIECPVLSFVGEVDEIAQPKAVRAIRHAAPRAEVYEVALHAGHFGLVVGRLATETTWPTVAAWTHWRAGRGELPDDVYRLEADGDEPERQPAAGLAATAAQSLQLAATVGVGSARAAVDLVSRTARVARELADEAPEQLRRLGRLEQVRPSTRISLGLLLDEQARSGPGEVVVLLEGRAYTREQVKNRIDAVVRGLISIGVRQGEHVGVLMAMRPSALTAVAALNRLGAVVVLLRPDGSPAREAEIGEVTRVIADPELAKLAAEVAPDRAYVLGGGGEPRDLGVPGVVDMERIDPDAVQLPAWFEANPGRARDLAFMIFVGEGERTRASRISNGRWVLSAFGTASSAALSASDTVYSVTPIYHSSGLLMGLGGAVAGGSRFAMATGFDPTSFWDEVRRYGVTVSTYTWTMLRELAEAPPHPGEDHHPVRLFMGSGMPRGVWTRVTKRFAPARVLEFYASAEGDAVLVNLSGQKPGSLGRPLPGSAPVEIAAYDARAGGLEIGSDGLGRRCRTGETGMLLVQVRPESLGVVEDPLRGVFEAGDAWIETGDLVRRDEDGDHWMVSPVAALVHTADGPVPPSPAQDALGELEAVDLVAAYGTKLRGADADVLIAAVTVRAGCKLTAQAITAALAELEPSQRPAVVHVVEQIPVTTWYRVQAAELKRQGVPKAGPKAWYLDREKGAYRPLTEAARRAVA